MPTRRLTGRKPLTTEDRHILGMKATPAMVQAIDAMSTVLETSRANTVLLCVLRGASELAVSLDFEPITLPDYVEKIAQGAQALPISAHDFLESEPPLVMVPPAREPMLMAHVPVSRFDRLEELAEHLSVPTGRLCIWAMVWHLNKLRASAGLEPLELKPRVQRELPAVLKHLSARTSTLDDAQDPLIPGASVKEALLVS